MGVWRFAGAFVFTVWVIWERLRWSVREGPIPLLVPEPECSSGSLILTTIDVVCWLLIKVSRIAGESAGSASLCRCEPMQCGGPGVRRAVWNCGRGSDALPSPAMEGHWGILRWAPDSHSFTFIWLIQCRLFAGADSGAGGAGWCAWQAGSGPEGSRCGRGSCWSCPEGVHALRPMSMHAYACMRARAVHASVLALLPAVLGSSELSSSRLRNERAPRGCQGSSSVSSSARVCRAVCWSSDCGMWAGPVQPLEHSRQPVPLSHH